MESCIVLLLVLAATSTVEAACAFQQAENQIARGGYFHYSCASATPYASVSVTSSGYPYSVWLLDQAGWECFSSGESDCACVNPSTGSSCTATSFLSSTTLFSDLTKGESYVVVVKNENPVLSATLGITISFTQTGPSETPSVTPSSSPLPPRYFGPSYCSMWNTLPSFCDMLDNCTGAVCNVALPKLDPFTVGMRFDVCESEHIPLVLTVTAQSGYTWTTTVTSPSIGSLGVPGLSSSAGGIFLQTHYEAPSKAHIALNLVAAVCIGNTCPASLQAQLANVALDYSDYSCGLRWWAKLLIAVVVIGVAGLAFRGYVWYLRVKKRRTLAEEWPVCARVGQTVLQRIRGWVGGRREGHEYQAMSMVTPLARDSDDDARYRAASGLSAGQHRNDAAGVDGADV